MGRDQGMTLIELVAAMAVFAVIAVMSVQALSGTLRARDRLTSLQADVAELAQPLAMLRNDLARTVPLLFFPPERAAPRSPMRLSAGNTQLGLSVAGQFGLDVQGQVQTDKVHRVEWRWDPEAGTLHRRAWRALKPLNQLAAGPEIRVMSGVTGLAVRSYWPAGIGWRDGIVSATPSVGNLDEDSAGVAGFLAELPYAVEVTLSTEAFGDIRLLETFQ